jgi:uncharacterized membrane protein YeaQ/YmgE (transglycosylase-associated protein family)
MQSSLHSRVETPSDWLFVDGRHSERSEESLFIFATLASAAKINSGDRMLTSIALLQQRTVVIEWWPRGIIAWLLLGLIAGWLAGKLARGRGFGCITDIVLGLIGSFIGGWVFTKLGIFGGGFLFSLAAATLGAVILVAIAHLFSGGSNT